MPYQLLIHWPAKDQLDAANDTYGIGFRTELAEWLTQLGAETSNRRRSTLWAPLSAERLTKKNLREWFPDRFGTLAERVQGLLYRFLVRRPGYEFGLAQRQFKGPGHLEFSVNAYLNVDHIRQRIIVAGLELLGGDEFSDDPGAAIGSSTTAITSAASQPSATVDVQRLDVGSAEWNELADARGRLIDKKYDEGLTPAERAELDRIERLTSAVLDGQFPRPLLSPDDRQRLTHMLGPDAEGPA